MKKITPIIPLAQEYTLTPLFSDEFNGTTLDDSKWYDFSPQWLGREPGFFDRNNVSVRDGVLCLTARALKPQEVSVENKARGFDLFSTAFVRSRTRIRYGYFEARCKSMSATVCNAFWLNDPLDPPAKYKEGDFSEEIDIFEVFGKDPEETQNSKNIYRTTIHRFATPYVETKVNSKNTPRGTQWNMPFRFDEDFHIYSFLWTPEIMEWFVDGKSVWKLDNEFYHRAMYMNFDCEIMKGWVGLPDPADLPGNFEIDYIRVWQRPE